MIEKVQPPITFDKSHNVAVVARDGEKFYVAPLDLIDPNADLIEMGARPLLQWALEVKYPLNLFVKVQRTLSEKFLGG